MRKKQVNFNGHPIYLKYRDRFLNVEEKLNFSVFETN